MIRLNAVTRGLRNGLVGLLLGMSLLLPAGPVAAQQNPLPGPEATLVLGQPDMASIGEGSELNQMYAPVDALIDPATKKVFVADMYNGRVLRFANWETLANGDPAEHVFGGLCPSAPGVPPSAECMTLPSAIDLDPSGRLWVYDSSLFRILRYDDAVEATDNVADGVLGTNVFTLAGNLDLEDIIVAGEDGDLLIARDWDNNKYLYWELSPLPANGTAPDLEQDSPVSDNPGLSYGRLAYDYATGGLWLQDYSKNRVLYYSNPRDLTTPQGVVGQKNLTDGIFNQNSQTMFYTMQGVWASYDGTLFVGDYDSYRMLAFRNAAERAVDQLGTETYVTADAVWGAPNFTTYGTYDYDATFVSYLYNIGGDPSTNSVVLAQEETNSVRLFGVIFPDDRSIDGTQTCELIPDMAITPEAIELPAGGETTVTVTMRNLCSDRAFNNSDLLISLSDGLTVSNGSAGMVNLGQRAAWQGLSLAPGETRSWQATVNAPAVLTTDPLHVVELYHQGGVAKRIDGVFVGATVTAPAAVAETAPAAPAPVAEATPAPAPALPATLPNTAGEAEAGTLLLLSALVLAVLGGTVLALRRR